MERYSQSDDKERDMGGEKPGGGEGDLVSSVFG